MLWGHECACIGGKTTERVASFFHTSTSAYFSTFFVPCQYASLQQKFSVFKGLSQFFVGIFCHHFTSSLEELIDRREPVALKPNLGERGPTFYLCIMDVVVASGAFALIVWYIRGRAMRMSEQEATPN